MKKKIVALFLVLAICCISIGSAFAATDSGNYEEEPNPTKQLLTLGGGLIHVSGSTYTLCGKVTSSIQDDLRVVAVLYQKDTEGEWHYITSVGNSGTGYTVSASKNVSLVSGTYRVTVFGFATYLERSMSKTYNI